MHNRSIDLSCVDLPKAPIKINEEKEDIDGIYIPREQISALLRLDRPLMYVSIGDPPKREKKKVVIIEERASDKDVIEEQQVVGIPKQVEDPIEAQIESKRCRISEPSNIPEVKEKLKLMTYWLGYDNVVYELAYRGTKHGFTLPAWYR